jgi:hypothetical protein
MSNAERQRKFQQANPGYDRRRKARERGMSKRDVARRRAEAAALALAAHAAAHAAATTQTMTATIQIPANKPLLMLPAPVKDPWMAEIEALAAARKSQAAQSPFVEVSARSSAARSR